MNIETPDPTLSKEGIFSEEESMMLKKQKDNQMLFTKLSELIDIYRARVKDIKQENNTISFENDPNS